MRGCDNIRTTTISSGARLGGHNLGTAGTILPILTWPFGAALDSCGTKAKEAGASRLTELDIGSTIRNS